MIAETTLQGIAVRFVDSDAHNAHILVERDGTTYNLGGITVVNGRAAFKAHSLPVDAAGLVELVNDRAAVYTSTGVV